MRLQLDSTGTKVDKVRPLAVAQPVFEFPSFGTIIENNLVYFANSQWSDSEENLEPVVVVSTPLDANEDLVPPELQHYLEQQRKQAEEKAEKAEKAEKEDGNEE